jgi:hypothetical protein
MGPEQSQARVPEDGPTQEWVMPLGLASATHASQWRERLGQAQEALSFISRQCDYYEWMEWLKTAPEAQGLRSLKMNSEWQDEYAQRVDLIELEYEDGSRYMRAPSSNGCTPIDMEMVPLKGEKTVSRWENTPKAKKVVGKFCQALWALDMEWGERFEGKKMGVDAQQWREELFAPEERAQWDAMLIQADCHAPGAKSSKPRI